MTPDLSSRRSRLAALEIVLAVEVVLFVVARSLSVDWTASYFRMVIGGVIFAIPVFVVIASGLRNRFRFGLRGALIH